MINISNTASPIWPKPVAQHIDQISVQKQGDQGAHLMDQAAESVAQAVAAHIKLNQSLIILVGNGNNGGDAIAAALKLHDFGFKPRLIGCSHELHSQSHLRKKYEQQLQQAGLSIEPYESGALKNHQSYFIVDGLLGLGFQGSLKNGTISLILGEVNQIANKTVLAIDVPSGLNADHWCPPHVPLTADLTVTFGAIKPIHAFDPGRSICGKIKCASIEFDRDTITELQPKMNLLAVDQTVFKNRSLWQKLPQNSHKFDRGHILVIGGSEGKWGAPILAATAAQRAGAGWISVSTPHPSVDTLGRLPHSLTSEDLWDQEKKNKIDASKLEKFIETRNVRSIVIGPGCIDTPLSSESMAVLSKKIKQHKIFVVIDAGALKDFSKWIPLNIPPLFDAKNILLTPHPGEWLRIGCDLDVPCQAKDLAVIQTKILKEWGVSLLLKGSTPITVYPENSDYLASVHISGNNQLARAGTGDILAGLAATIGSQGIPAYDAGIWAYSMLCDAADHAAQNGHNQGITPEDMIEAISYVVK